MKKMIKMTALTMAFVAGLGISLLTEAANLPSDTLPSQTNIAPVQTNPVNWDSMVGKRIANTKDPAYGSSNPFKPGLCTWYAWGRMKEVTGKSITFRSKPAHAAAWPDFVNNCTVNGKLTEKCVAVNFRGTAGHVAFVEYVDDTYVYYTEDNESPGTNRKVLKTTIRDFRQTFVNFIH